MSDGSDDEQQRRETDVWIDAVLTGRTFYKLAGPPPDDLPVPIDFLRPRVEEYVAKSRQLDRPHSITIARGHYAPVAVRSTLFPKKYESLILLHTSLNFCYRRFATAVEFANLILGENKAYRTDDMLEHLTGLLAGFPAGPNTSLHAEALAPLIAVEMLMPMAHSEKANKLLQGGSAMDLATAFRIPLYVAEWSMAGAWRHRAALHRDIKDPPPKPPDH